MADLDQSVDLLNPLSLALFLVDPDIYSSSIVQLPLPVPSTPVQNNTLASPYVMGLSPIPMVGTPRQHSQALTRTSTPLHQQPINMMDLLVTDDFISTPEEVEDNYQQPLSASVLCNMGDFFQNAMDINSSSPSSKTKPNKSTRPPLKERQQGKPAETYVALIAKALLSSNTGRMTLSQIYEYIMDNYLFYRTTTLAWRNAVRHNLAINECFVKAGKTEVGRGYYWAIHASYVRSFNKGHFTVTRRRTPTTQNDVLSSMPTFQPTSKSTTQKQLSQITTKHTQTTNQQRSSNLRSIRL